DGDWDFAYDDEGLWSEPDGVTYDRMIRVPFPPESRASGIGDVRFHPRCWYRRRLELAQAEREQRALIHFGAVDYRAWVYVNGHLVAQHQGGHTPFVAEIPPKVRRDRHIELVVRVEDDPTDLAQPRGKQDWQEIPHEIWYPRTTGIWQTVWLESVPITHIGRVRWTPHLEEWELGVT